MGDLSKANACYDQAIELTADPDIRAWIANKRHRRQDVIRAGAKISYWEHGSSGKTIVLVFPLNYDIALFQPLVEQLCQEYRIVTIEPRGSGDSDPLPRPYSFGEQAEDVRAVIEALDAGPVTAVGMSLGGARFSSPFQRARAGRLSAGRRQRRDCNFAPRASLQRVQ
jgi:pimeloyl-ACP methyl ester carboxylesterase